MARLELIRDIEVDGSRWVAAHNHITFGMQAFSDEVESITDIDGFCRIFHSVGAGGVLPPGHRVGVSLVLHSPNEYIYVKGVITAISGSWFFDTNIPFKSINFSGGYILSSVVLNVTAFITNLRDSGSIEALYFANANGQVRADLSPFALSILKLSRVTDFSEASHIDVLKDAFLRVIFGLNVIRDGVGESAPPIDPIDFNAVKGARQLRENNGENYRENLLDETGTTKFLNDFEVPSAWVGYPFSLSFIFDKIESESFDNFTDRHIDQFDINGVQLGSSTVNLNPNHQGFITFLTFENEPVQASADFFEVYLEDNDEPLPDEGYWNTFDKPSYAAGGYVEGNV